MTNFASQAVEQGYLKRNVAAFEGGAFTIDRKIYLGASKWREQKSLNCFTTLSLVAMMSNSHFDSFPLKSSGFFRQLILKHSVRNPLRRMCCNLVVEPKVGVDDRKFSSSQRTDRE
jgi:hypothetical protein